MPAEKLRKGKKRTIRVINTKNQNQYISKSDAEMDYRGRQAVKAAIHKAKVCKKPIARYDASAKKAYIEYADGARVYVE